MEVEPPPTPAFYGHRAITTCGAKASLRITPGARASRLRAAVVRQFGMACASRVQSAMLAGKSEQGPGGWGMNQQTPIEAAWRNVELGASDEKFQNLHEFITKARIQLNQNAWDYIIGGAETETTLRRNRMALDEIAFRPRVLRDVSKVD
ncbi:MAG: alpha-hydroxy-acid oxidizing protein, partial [Bradyrhizobium sp.]|nr:alpha-hydroxy-acid oxidizing protein [Bradyrhizobium sp.]